MLTIWEYYKKRSKEAHKVGFGDREIRTLKVKRVGGRNTLAKEDEVKM